MSKYIIVVFYLQSIVASGKICRINYKVDKEIISLVGNNRINYVVTQLPQTACSNTLEIETQQWVHNCCINISSGPRFEIQLKNRIYPEITVYIGLNSPLSYIQLSGTGSIQTLNRLRSDNLTIEMLDASYGDVNVEISSNLNVFTYSDSNLTLSGHVRGTGIIHVTGAGRFDGKRCLIEKVTLITFGPSTVYVVGRFQLDLHVFGRSTVYYKGPLYILHRAGTAIVKSMNTWGDQLFTSIANENIWGFPSFILSIGILVFFQMY